MKTLKFILIAATLMVSSVVSTLSAQQKDVPAYQWKVALGDSVMIKPECQQYLTGEKPSVWVYDKVHTVGQLGTKRFPEGVLLMNIYSWICEDCLIPVPVQEEQTKVSKPVKERTPAPVVEEPVKEQETKPVEQPIVEQKPVEQPVVQPVEDQQPIEQPVVQPVEEQQLIEQPVVQPVEDQQPIEQPVVQPVEEQKPIEQPIEQPVEDHQPIEQPIVDGMTHQTAKGDSIHSKQNFLGGYDRFTIGLRGGAASLLHHAVKGNWTCGGDVVLDLQYAHYWTKDGRPADLGIITGVSVGYAQSALSNKYDSTAFTTGNVNYTVVARDIKETDHTIQLEVPLMFSMIHENGVFLNIGPKFMVPVYSPSKQTLDQENTHITAYFPETGITITDQMVTGKYTGQQPTTDNGVKYKINIMLTAELGYEWILKSGNSLGLGAYANYSVFNTYSNTTSTVGLFNLTAPTDDDKAHLDVLSATKTYTDKLGFFDAGVKVAYHFNFPKKKKNLDSKLF